ncbi:unnamed protein product, partial [Orchesella dallaii]
RKWCDYVVWTPHDIFIQRTERNEETLATWEAMKLKLKQFWFEDLVNWLIPDWKETTKSSAALLLG